VSKSECYNGDIHTKIHTHTYHTYHTHVRTYIHTFLYIYIYFTCHRDDGIAGRVADDGLGRKEGWKCRGSEGRKEGKKCRGSEKRKLKKERKLKEGS
jgi:hypothetical protein